MRLREMHGNRAERRSIGPEQRNGYDRPVACGACHLVERRVRFVSNDVFDDDRLACVERAPAGSAALLRRYVLKRREETGVESLVRHDRQGVAAGIQQLDVSLRRAGERHHRLQDLIEPRGKVLRFPQTRARLAEAGKGRRLRSQPVPALVDLAVRALAIRDVTGDLRRADDGPPGVAYRRHGQRYRNPAAVLAEADRVEMLDSLARAYPLDDGALLVLELGGNDRGDVLADDFIGGVAEYALRAGVPRLDHPLQRLADDRVIRRVHDRGKL